MNRRSFFATVLGGAAAALVAPLVPAVPVEPKLIPFRRGGIIGTPYTKKCRWPLTDRTCALPPQHYNMRCVIVPFDHGFQT